MYHATPCLIILCKCPFKNNDRQLYTLQKSIMSTLVHILMNLFLSRGINIVNWITMTRKICRTPTHNIREYWTADSTLLGLISSVYCNLHHWRSNQRPQITVLKLYNWASSSYRTQVSLNKLVMVIARPNVSPCWVILCQSQFDNYSLQLYTLHLSCQPLSGYFIPKCLQMARETRVQSQVEPYQRH